MTLKIEQRAEDVKAKRLRKDGLVPCSLNDSATAEGLLFTVPVKEAAKLCKTMGRGGRVTLELGETQIPAMLKGIGYSPDGGQIYDLAFEKIYEDQRITGYAQVVLKNKEMVSTMVQLLQREIPYKALPKDMVEVIEMDLGKYHPGSQVMVKDIAELQKPELEVLINQDRMVMSIVGK